MKMKDWLVEHFPAKKKFGLKKVYREHISSAENHIVLVTPYFMPKRWLISLLHQAVIRGVSVEILVPKTTDHYTVDRVNYYYMYKLQALGVKFFVEDEMNHAKIMVIDNKEAIVGSQNLDFLSFDMNYEVGIFFKNMEAIGRINRIINEWKTRAQILEKTAYKRQWFDYVLIPIIKFSAMFFNK